MAEPRPDRQILRDAIESASPVLTNLYRTAIRLQDRYLANELRTLLSRIDKPSVIYKEGDWVQLWGNNQSWAGRRAVVVGVPYKSGLPYYYRIQFPRGKNEYDIEWSEVHRDEPTNDERIAWVAKKIQGD